ncbi:MAG: J domain-containing protein [Candidatus Altiarchaeota archaeon]|nr:J domain-containing protein [Candidatus Altiarchaeota archaeon]
MESNSFKQINEARKTLGLGETATLREIKNAYRRMVKIYHPDKREKRDRKDCEKHMKEINKAYELLTEYCMNYKYSFTKKEVEDSYSRYMKGFSEDWMWGPGKEKKEGKKSVKRSYRGI